MTFKAWHHRNIIFITLSVLLLGVMTGCQPQATTESTQDIDASVSPIVMNDDSVTMGSEYIISIKPSRYQPSLGLQGDIEAVKRVQLMTAQDVVVKQILVTDKQWVAKGTPLLIVQRSQTSQPDQSRNLPAHELSSNDIINEHDPLNHNDGLSTFHTNQDKMTKQHNLAQVNKDNNVSNKNNDSVENKVINNKIMDSDIKQTLDNKDKENTLITIRASFSGRVASLSVKEDHVVTKGKSLLHIADDRELRFIATLPIQAESQLSVGQSVNFAADAMRQRFNGQISALKIIEGSEQLQVYVDIIDDDTNRNMLKPTMTATGWVDYGQIEVGTIMPGYGIHDADLSSLRQPPYRPLSPLAANVWIIKQDQRLTRQPVEVIKYEPETGQYLIAGVSNDSLICLAKLPIESAGKKVTVS